MGICRGSARLLFDEAQRRPFSGSVLELGKMFVFFRDDELQAWAGQHQFELTEAEVGLSHDPALAAHGCMDDRSFFSRLGFDRVMSSDASDWEGADLSLDLNQPVPTEQVGQYDVVYEGGTIQHVFDQRQVFENIFRLLKPGGRVVHGMSPSSNNLDLGFYMFSPTMFYDWYAANGFEINTFMLFDYVAYWVKGRLFTTPWNLYAYEPGCMDHLSYGRLGNRQVGLFVVATKTADATADVIPQQGFYRQLWEDRQHSAARPTSGAPASAAAPAMPAIASTKVSAAQRWWKLGREVAIRWLPKRMPKRVARY